MLKLRLTALSLLTSGSLSAAPAFVPDDPYFPVDFTGTFYPGQWHLDNQVPIDFENIGLDVNILGAWNQGWTGSGVTIAIVDEGTEGNHPDLIEGFQNQYSWSFGETQADNLLNPYRGSPVISGIGEDSHGTSVAGVAAARGGNGIGLTGAAPLANIAAEYLLVQSVPDGRTEGQVEAAAILFQGQTDAGGNPNPYVSHDWSTVPVRVKNHSYGPEEGYQFDEDFELVISALAESASHGVIHVFSAGNERIVDGWDPTPTADANKNLVATLGDNIIVAALGSDGVYSGYSSYGANVFVTAPSNSSSSLEISTTDRVGIGEGYNYDPGEPDEPFDSRGEYDYSSTFGGTSSAAPLVAGIMALGVEANPNMDVRMAKHLMVQTNRIVDADDSSTTGEWITNGAGNQFNNNYGFGLIDAGAFTEAATRVDTLTAQTEFTTGDIVVNQSFVPGGDNVIEETFSVSVAPVDWQPLEHVIIELTIIGLQTDWAAYNPVSGSGIGSILGDFSARLISPMGTNNDLFFNDRALMDSPFEERRDFDSSELTWQFLSNAYWGEDPDGDWLLELYNDTGNALTGTWSDFSFSAAMGQLTLVPEPGAFATLLALAILPTLLARRRGRIAE